MRAESSGGSGEKENSSAAGSYSEARRVFCQDSALSSSAL